MTSTPASKELGRILSGALSNAPELTGATSLARAVGLTSSAGVSRLLSGNWGARAPVGEAKLWEVIRTLGLKDRAGPGPLEGEEERKKLLALFREAQATSKQGRPDAGPPTNAGSVQSSPPLVLDRQLQARQEIEGSLLDRTLLRRALASYVVGPPGFAADPLGAAIRARLEQIGSSDIVIHELDDQAVSERGRRNELRRAVKERGRQAHVAILIITGTYLADFHHSHLDHSAFEEALQVLVAEAVPTLLYITPEALLLHERRASESGERSLIDRLYYYKPRFSASGTLYFRSVFAPSQASLLRDIVDTLSKLLAGSLKYYREVCDRIWSDHRLADLESHAREVWVYTPNFYFELNDELFSEIVVQNVLRPGFHGYRFLFPQSELSSAQALFQAVLERFAESPLSSTPTSPGEKLRFFTFPDELTPWWPQLSIYEPKLYGPKDKDGKVPEEENGAAQAFMYDLWDRETGLETSHNYWIPPKRVALAIRDYENLCKSNEEVFPDQQV